MTPNEINARIEAISAPARERMRKAKRVSLYPTEYDWMTDAELSELHELQLLDIHHQDNTTAAARERVKIKRARRLAEQRQQLAR